MVLSWSQLPPDALDNLRDKQIKSADCQYAVVDNLLPCSPDRLQERRVETGREAGIDHWP